MCLNCNKLYHFFFVHSGMQKQILISSEKQIRSIEERNERSTFSRFLLKKFRHESRDLNKPIRIRHVIIEPIITLQSLTWHNTVCSFLPEGNFERRETFARDKKKIYRLLVMVRVGGKTLLLLLYQKKNF